MTNKEYQKEYWIKNPDKYQQMLSRARKLKRNRKNRRNCILSDEKIKECSIPSTVGINYKSCICENKCDNYAGERNLKC